MAVFWMLSQYLPVGCLVRHGHAPAPSPLPQEYSASEVQGERRAETRSSYAEPQPSLAMHLKCIAKVRHGENRFVRVIQQNRLNRQIRRSFNILSVNAQIMLDALHHIGGETGILWAVVQTAQVGHQFGTVLYLAPQFAQAARRLDVAGIQCIGQLLFRIVFYF